MPTHDPHHPINPNDPDERLAHESEEFMRLQQGSDPESRKVGYEIADANVKDTAIFLVIVGVSLCVVFVLAFGIGKLIYMELGRQDGPPNKWAQMSGVKPGNLESDPRIQQQQLQQMVKRFPTPRLQTDDGNMEVAQMHAREDMLLNHYSWVDEQKQTVRIPIARAMQLIAQRGLPVESDQTAEEKPMFGDGSRAVTAPLTDGFARTGPELQMIEARQQRMEGVTPQNAHAELQPAH
ncbi:MAG: hypothetical protein WA708_12850 [Acidobacteriaceae bacterium]